MDVVVVLTRRTNTRRWRSLQTFAGAHGGDQAVLARWHRAFIPGIEYALRYAASIGAAILLIMFGLSLAGPHPMHGLRGGIFCTLVVMFLIFFLSRGIALSTS